MDLAAWQELTDDERAQISQFIKDGQGKFGSNPFGDLLGKYDAAGAWNKLNNGQISALDAQSQLAGAGIDLTPEQQEFLTNKLNAEAADKANQFEEYMRDTSITSAADQYSSLGLNPASVMTTGGAGIGNSSTADVSNKNVAQEKMLQNVEKKAAMTRTILGIVGGLASAGIYGSAITAGRVAASKIASSTAHSAESTLHYFFDKDGNNRGYTITDRQWK